MAVWAAAVGTAQVTAHASSAAEPGGVGAVLRADAGVPGVGTVVPLVADATSTAGGRPVLPATMRRGTVAVRGTRLPRAAGPKRGELAGLREATGVAVAKVAAPVLTTRRAARLRPLATGC